MDYLMSIIDTIKSIELKQIITILIAIGTVIFFYIFCNTFSYIIVKLFNIKIKDKEKVKRNSFYTPLKIFFTLLGVYLATIILKLSPNIMLIVNRVFKVISIILFTIGFAGIINVDSKFIKRIQKN